MEGIAPVSPLPMCVFFFFATCWYLIFFFLAIALSARAKMGQGGRERERDSNWAMRNGGMWCDFDKLCVFFDQSRKRGFFLSPQKNLSLSFSEGGIAAIEEIVQIALAFVSL